jgi:predicted nuclease with TOPRIM domain
MAQLFGIAEDERQRADAAENELAKVKEWLAAAEGKLKHAPPTPDRAVSKRAVADTPGSSAGPPPSDVDPLAVTAIFVPSPAPAAVIEPRSDAVALQARIDALNTELLKRDGQSAAHSADLASLRQKLSAQENLVASLQSQLADTHRSVALTSNQSEAALRAEREGADMDRENAKSALEHAQQQHALEIKQLRDQIAELQQEHAALLARSDQDKAQLNVKIASLTTEKVALADQLKSLEAEHRRLEARLTSLQEDNLTLTTQLKSLTADLQRTQADCEAKQHRLSELQSQLARHELPASLQPVHAHCESEIAQLKSDLASTAAQLAQADVKRSFEVAAVRAEDRAHIGNLQAEIQTLHRNAAMQLSLRGEVQQQLQEARLSLEMVQRHEQEASRHLRQQTLPVSMGSFGGQSLHPQQYHTLLNGTSTKPLVASFSFTRASRGPSEVPPDATAAAPPLPGDAIAPTSSPLDMQYRYDVSAPSTARNSLK